MKKCDLCDREDIIHYRVKSVKYKNLLSIKIGFFLAEIVGILFQNKSNICMEGLESHNKKNYINKIINYFQK